MGFYNNRFKKVRFHAQFGPESLFERVKYKMKDVTQLYLDGEHFQKRACERDIPDSIIKRLLHFDINEWKVVTASVRSDSGKFIDSTWEISINGIRYWVTIGLGSFIVTIVKKDCSGVENCIRSGEFFDFVEQVNRKLMEKDLTIVS
jgi:hypothetical protein